MKAYILRGLPGSGKSTWAETQNMKGGVCIYSADSFHIIDGKYCYDPKRAGFAHAECLRTYVEDIRIGKHDIFIVDNTNTRIHEMAPYIAVANAFGVDHEILQFNCSIDQSIARNIHGVPHGTIVSMNVALQTEHLPVHWNVKCCQW